MKNWRGLFEIVKFPIEVVFVALLLSGIGNILTNNIFGIEYMINNEYINMFGEVMMKAAQFMIVNFPLLFLLRLVSRKQGTSITMISALIGYVTFLVTTMVVARGDLTSTAYSSILGMSLSKSSIVAYTGSTRYPLQTGLLGCASIAFITLLSYNQSKKKSEYGFFSFISKEVACTLHTFIDALIVGVLFSFAWPYVMMVIDKLVSFISVDTTNPINLTLYGILDGLFSTFNLSTYIRFPFWYNINGGSWVGMSGAVTSGDVSIWSAQLASGATAGQVGRFITPYYVLNLFALPALIWAMYSLQTNPIHKPKTRMLCIVATIVSWISGCMLPLEMMLLFLAPLLFVAHLACSGILFGLLQGLHIYLGFNSTEVSTMTAMPGTLPELITYLTSSTDYRATILSICVVGLAMMVIYFFMTRFYFEKLAVDLFKTGDKERLVKGALKALGGIENIKSVESDCFALYVSVYASEKIDIARLKRLGATRIYETRLGYDIHFGSSSTMLRKEIMKERRTVESA